MAKLFLLAATLLFGNTALAQERAKPDVFEDPDVMAWLIRTALSLEIMEGETQVESDMQPTEQQVSEIKNIAASHQEMMAFGAEVPPEKAANKKYVNEIYGFYISELKTLEVKLSQNVLLPHQATLLSQKLFRKYMEASGGDILKVITENYCDKIKIGDVRKGKLAKIAESSKKQIAEAKKKFKAEIQRILKEGNEAASELLTAEEKAVLGLSAK